MDKSGMSNAYHIINKFEDKVGILKNKEHRVKVWDNLNKCMFGFFSIYELPTIIGQTYPDMRTNRFIRRFSILFNTGFVDEAMNEMFEGDIIYNKERNESHVIFKNDKETYVAYPIDKGSIYPLHSGCGVVVGTICEL